ncbi:MAG: hypothetical protein M3457_17930, partial [Chloroflexota bacterium]|nr:hypothetical protein [Chloroflexota bacterium]
KGDAVVGLDLLAELADHRLDHRAGGAADLLEVRDTIRPSLLFDGPTATTFNDLFEDCSSR